MRSNIMQCLVCLHLSCRLLQLGMGGTVIKTQNLPTLIYMVARNPVGHFLAWDFVKKHWNELVEK